MEISRVMVEERLAAAGLAYVVLDLSPEHAVLVTERWGRVLGPFDSTGRSLMWLNPQVWASEEAFSTAITEGLWNVGGERFWIAPEIRLNNRDRTAFWDTYKVPAAMDPGSWKLASGRGSAALYQELAMDVYNPPAGELRLRVERSVVPVTNPLRYLSSAERLMQGVSCAGYSHGVSLAMTGPQASGVQCEAWTLCQLNPPGTILVPCTTRVEYQDYYEPVDSGCLHFLEGAAVFSVTGTRRYKVGLRSPHLLGRAAYIKLAGPRSELLVRTFPNDPSSEYVEEPDSLPGCRGLSFHVYNDGGEFGGFGELECNGRTIGAGTSRIESRDEFGFWYFLGSRERIIDIGRILLGNGVDRLQEQFQTD